MKFLSAAAALIAAFFVAASPAMVHAQAIAVAPALASRYADTTPAPNNVRTNIASLARAGQVQQVVEQLLMFPEYSFDLTDVATLNGLSPADLVAAAAPLTGSGTTDFPTTALQDVMEAAVASTSRSAIAAQTSIDEIVDAAISANPEVATSIMAGAVSGIASSSLNLTPQAYEATTESLAQQLFEQEPQLTLQVLEGMAAGAPELAAELTAVAMNSPQARALFSPSQISTTATMALAAAGDAPFGDTPGDILAVVSTSPDVSEAEFNAAVQGVASETGMSVDDLAVQFETAEVEQVGADQADQDTTPDAAPDLVLSANSFTASSESVQQQGSPN